MRFIITISYLLIISNILSAQRLESNDAKPTVTKIHCNGNGVDCDKFITINYNNLYKSLTLINHGNSKIIFYTNLININSGQTNVLMRKTLLNNKLVIPLENLKEGELYEAQVLAKDADNVGSSPNIYSIHYRFYY